MLKIKTINISNILPNISYNGKFAGNIKERNKQGNKKRQVDRWRGK
jgi:hypothetical protein